MERLIIICFCIFLLGLPRLYSQGTTLPVQACYCVKESNLVVTKNTDNETSPEKGSLRWAINCRNSNCTGDVSTITFQLPSNQKTIFLKAKLVINYGNKLTIDGSNSGVIIDGTDLNLTDAAIHIKSSNVVITGLEFREFDGGNDNSTEVIQVVKEQSNQTISNVNITNNYFYNIDGEANAITIGEIEGVLISGNYFGVNRNLTKMPIGRMGIRITNGAENATFNILSNHIYACDYGIGVLTSATNSFNLNIKGNTIGGPNGLGNTVAGIYINGAGTNFTISENREINYNKVGIEIRDCLSYGDNEISYNPIGYSLENGINLLTTFNFMFIHDNSINNNTQFGINLGNATVSRVIMRFNKFSCNKSGGINLASGANRSILPPTITTAYTNKIAGTGNSRHEVDIYAHNKNNNCTPDVCQGYRLIGSVLVPSDGKWSLTNFISPLIEGDQIIATQTCAIFEECWETSAFSICEDVINPCKNYKVSLTTPDDKLCAGQTLQLSATISGGLSANTTGTWFDPNDLSKPVSNLSTVTTTYPNVLPGLYRITMKNNDGCSASANIQISVSSNLKATISPAATTVCAGTPANLSVTPSGGVPTYKYLWSDNNKTTQMITTPPLQNASTFRVTVTDSYGCTAIGIVSVGVAAPPTVNAGTDTSFCASTSDRTFELKGVQLISPVTTGAWSKLGNTGTLSSEAFTSSPHLVRCTIPANFSGTLTLKLTSNKPNVCPAAEDTKTIIVHALPQPQIMIEETSGKLINDGILCAGQSATLKASGGNTYKWSNNATTASIPVSSSGTYTVTATIIYNNNVCSNHISKVIIVNPQPSVNITSGNNNICRGQSTPLTASGNGTFKWSNNKTSAMITEIPTQSTRYSVTLTDGNGCTNTDTFTVSVAQPYTIDAIAAQKVCTNNSVALSGTLTGTTSSLWTSRGTGTFGNAAALNTQYIPSNKDFTDGKVTLILSSNVSGGACPNVKDSVTINLNKPIQITSGISAPICQSPMPMPVLLSGASISGGTGIWSIVSGTGSLTRTLQTQRPDTVHFKPVPNFSGTVTLRLKVIDPQQICPADSATRILDIRALPSPGISIVENSGKQNNDGILCIGAKATLTATGGNTYLWSTGSTITTASITVSNPGTYTVTVTGTNGCSSTNNKIITVNTPPPVNISGTNTICQGQSVTLLASGNGTFAWSNSQTGTSIKESPTQTTDYTVTLTDGNACTSADTFRVVVEFPGTANAGIDQRVCANTPLTLSGRLTGATTGLWKSLGTGTFLNPAVLNTTYTPSSNDITAGKVTLTLSSSSSGVCPNVTDSVTIQLSAPLRANAGTTAPFCQSPIPTPVLLSGANITRGVAVWSLVSGAGSLTHTLQTQRPDTVRFRPAPNFSGTITLRLKASDPEKICPADSTDRVLNITALPVPSISIVETSGKQNNDGILCIRASATLNATGGNTYSWSTNNATTASITVTNPGTYTVTVTLNGCSDTKDVVIRVNGLPSVTILGNDNICRGQSLTLTATGNGTYKWSNNVNLTGNSNPVSPTQTTTYTVTLTNANACSNSANFTVVVNNPAEVKAGNDQTVCAGAQLVLSGTLSGAATSSTWKSLGTGSFNNSQTRNAIYTPSAADVTAGKVSLILTSNDPDGACPAGLDTLIAVLQKLPSFNLTAKQPGDCTAPNGVITLQGLIPRQIYTIHYTDDGTSIKLENQTADGNGIINIPGLDYGQYTNIKVTDPLGCISPSTDFRLTPSTETFRGDSSALCVGREKDIEVDIFNAPNATVEWKDLQTGTATAYSIRRNGRNITLDAAKATAGVVHLEYTVNDRGCLFRVAKDVTLNPAPAPIIDLTEQSGIAPNDGIICKNDSVSLKIRGQFMSCQWLEPKVNQPMITVAQEGIYLVTVTDNKGCQGSTTQKIVVKEAPYIEPVALVDAFCNGSPQASITITAKGGLEPYTYNWSNGDTNIRLNAVKAGTYQLTLTDANHCISNAAFTLKEPPPLILRLVDTNAVTGPQIKDGTATLEISGGTAAYSLSWTGPLANSMAILSAETITLRNLIAGEYQLKLVDRFQCSTQASFTIGGFSCTPSNPGSLQNTLQTVCPELIYTAKFVTNPAPLQPLERLEYILHDQAGETLGKVFNRSSTPEISFKPPLEAGKTYYLSAVTGRAGADGLLDLTYPCLSVAKGTPVRFVAKALVQLSPIVGKDTLCPGENLLLETSGVNEAQRYNWVLPNQQTLSTNIPKLEIKKVQGENAGDYRVFAVKEGCTISEAPRFTLFVHGLKSGEEIYAGEDVAICNNQFSLHASPISSAKGEWFVSSKAVIAEKFNASTLVSELQLGNNEFIWVVSSEKCKEIGRDTIVVAFGTKVRAVKDSLALEIETGKLIDLNVLENDSFNLSFKTELQALDPPGFGSIRLPSFGTKIPQFTFQDPDGRRGNFAFRYAICQSDNPCPNNCDTATAQLSILHLPALMEVFTPNGNMKNETLQFLALGDGNEDLTMKIIILNRWGDVVFKSDDYIRLKQWWDGTHQNKKVPTGTYYAKIIYSSPDGKPLGGTIRKAITVLH